jgi:hypothetical protein
MTVKTEYVFLGHDNSIDLILMAQPGDSDTYSAIDLSGVSKVTLTFEGVTIEDTNKDALPILWNQTGYSLGEIHFQLGGQALPEGEGLAWIVIYDSIYTNGLAIEKPLPLLVRAEIEVP